MTEDEKDREIVKALLFYLDKNLLTTGQNGLVANRNFDDPNVALAAVAYVSYKSQEGTRNATRRLMWVTFVLASATVVMAITNLLGGLGWL